jgi:hypothetical protein
MPMSVCSEIAFGALAAATNDMMRSTNRVLGERANMDSKSSLAAARVAAAALVALALGAISCLLVGPAEAHTADRTDPRGDVWRPKGFDGWKRARTVPNVDVREFVVRNAAHRVVIKARYTNLVANADELDLSVDFKSAGAMRTVSAQVNSGSPDGFFVVTTPSRRVKCDLRGQVDYDDETIRVVVPHRCIGKGDWLRFDPMNRRYNEQTGIRYDDPMTRAGETYAWSPRLHRGMTARAAG